MNDKATNVDKKRSIDAQLLFDEQFSIERFEDAVTDTEEKADSIIEKAKGSVKKAFSMESKDDYIVDFSEEEKEAIRKGDLCLVTNKKGEIYAQFKDEHNRFSRRVPIKQELQEVGVTVEELESALQVEAIKGLLRNIISELKEIETGVKEMLEGQRNDRIGLFYSGVSLYSEAQAIRDPVLQKHVTAQALKSLSDSNSQMIQDIRSNIKYLVNKEFVKEKDKTRRVNERVAVIHNCYDIVFKASFMKAAIYHESGEVGAALEAIDEYGRFIEKLIVPYSGLLSEYDRNEKFIEKGTWGTIAGTLRGCGDLRRQILNRQVYVIDMREAKNA